MPNLMRFLGESTLFADAQHSFGTVSDPDEFVACETLPCGHRSTRHPLT